MQGCLRPMRLWKPTESGRALQQICEVVSYDERLAGIRDQLYDVEAIISDIHHEITSYMDDLTFDEAELAQMEERLDLIHNMQAKYGNTIEKIRQSYEEKCSPLRAAEAF